MADKAHIATDHKLAEMEAHLSAIYAQAEKEIEKKAAEYFAQFEKLDAQKRKLVEDGKLTVDAYKQWRRNKLMYGKHWTNLKAKIAEEYANVNRTALAYVNGQLPEVYALNYNDIGSDLDDKIKGYSFELVDAHTVKNLATSDQTLLPYKYLNGVRDVRWNTQKVNSAVLQGILQGESIPNLAKRLQSVTNMNKVSAIRNARTAVTGAECKGRQDSYEKATQDGIKLKREWISAIDYRTRHAHRLLDGQLVDVNESFKSELGPIMFPGDPSADPANVYNCRCTIAAKVIGFNKVQVQKAMAEKQAEGQPTMQAKTKAEAETIAKQFGVNADYSNYDISVANAVNRTMQRTVDEFGPHALDALKSIGTDATGKSRAGGFDEFSGKLSLTGTKGKDALFKMGEKTRKANERYQRMGMRYFSAEDDMSTIHHEFGHIIHVSVGGSTTSTAATALDKEIIAFMRDKNTKVVSELSYYASINHNELISECVAQYMAGNPGDIALGVVDILKKYGLRKNK